MKVEEQYLDDLQNIEAAIVSVYEDQPTLLDVDVLDALDALIRTYTWEKEARGTPTVRLSERAQQVYDFSRRICEWRIGRQSLSQSKVHREKERPVEITLPEILVCLQQIRRSARFWHNQGGRQGYLNYVRQFLGNPAPDA